MGERRKNISLSICSTPGIAGYRLELVVGQGEPAEHRSHVVSRAMLSRWLRLWSDGSSLVWASFADPDEAAALRNHVLRFGQARLAEMDALQAEGLAEGWV